MDVRQLPPLYVSFSGGKDSTIMLHLVAAEARKRGRRFGMLLVDLEGQYKCTIEHVERCYEMYADCADPYWVALPISLRNAVSVYEPKWLCWDPDKRDVWIREPHELAITDPEHFPFFRSGHGVRGVRPRVRRVVRATDRRRGAAADRLPRRDPRRRVPQPVPHHRLHQQVPLDGKQYTSLVTPNVYNVYPIYDWRTQDLWAWHGRNPDAPYNRLYDLMGMAGLTINQMRICQPYGDDQRRGLWLFHLIEPETWARVVARVNGANGGALYVQEWGNINGYRRVTKPPGHTWRSFAELLVKSMPPQMEEHYRNKILLFQKWWADRGYPDGIPEEADYQVEAKRLAPSWRRVCKSLLRNDYWCKGLGFTQHKSDAYRQYLDLMRRRREAWGVEDGQLEFVTEAGEVREEAMA
jgi:predicted phosphoadenosine phosphosulfate sulfurtransferase